MGLVQENADLVFGDLEVVDKDFLALGFEKVLGEKKKDLLPLKKKALEAGFNALKNK